jgi:multimeric flavodoxin WrbA
LERKILIISGSARNNSDTTHYIEKVFSNRPHTHINLLDSIIYPYDYAEVYPDDDGFLSIAQQMLDHDVLVFATPVYWYSMSGRMKDFFDRFTDLMHVHKPIGKQLKGKKLFLLAISASEELPEGFTIPFSETAGYFNMEYGGHLAFNSDNPDEDRTEDINNFIQKIYNN